MKCENRKQESVYCGIIAKISAKMFLKYRYKSEVVESKALRSFAVEQNITFAFETKLKQNNPHNCIAPNMLSKKQIVDS